MSESPAWSVGKAFSPLRSRLDNGLTVLCQRNPASAAVSATLNVVAGATLEVSASATGGLADSTDGLSTGSPLGLASLVARGTTRGTMRRSKQEIGELLDFVGADLAGDAGRHAAGIGVRGRPADFEPLLELLAEVAREPEFPQREISQIKGDRVTSLREAADDPAHVMDTAFRELIYPAEHPYATPARGTVESVDALGRDDFVAFHAAHYRPEASLLVIVGNVDEHSALEAAERGFGSWSSVAANSVQAPAEAGAATQTSYRTLQPEIPDAPELGAIRAVVRPMMNKTQAELALGHPGIRRNDPEYYGAALMNMILGRFAMGGRLGRIVREEKGMAYTTYSALRAGLGAGAFVVRAGVQPHHVEPALEAIVAEIHRMATQPVEPQELDDACSAIVRSLPRSLESNAGIAGLMRQIEVHDLGLDYLDRFPALMQAVTVDDVTRAARRVLRPNGYAVAVAGPYEEPGDRSLTQWLVGK